MHLNRRDPAQKRSRYLWRGVREREQVTSDQISIRMQQSSLFLSLSLSFPLLHRLTSTTKRSKRRRGQRRQRAVSVRARQRTVWISPSMRIWPLRVYVYVEASWRGYTTARVCRWWPLVGVPQGSIHGAALYSARGPHGFTGSARRRRRRRRRSNA